MSSRWHPRPATITAYARDARTGFPWAVKSSGVVFDG